MHNLLLVLALVLSSQQPVPDAQQPGQEAEVEATRPPSPLDGIEWVEGPGEGLLGRYAKIAVPEGFRFTGAKGAQLLLEAMENPTSGSELGLLACDSEVEGGSWFVVFDFSDSGYVKDEDRDDLDADALMETMKEGNEVGNEQRQERGWETIDLVGWKREPFYDPRTNNLTWATLIRSASGGESVNWSVRVLGRKGVMNIDLVLGPDALDAALPEFEKVIDSFEYLEGHKYAQFTAGDKVAEYGLAALVVGGGAAVAAKLGLFAKLGKFLAPFFKFIAIGVVAIGAFAKKIWGWISGRSRNETPEPEKS
jgi:uncharacterized membrane-anchored protein